MRLSAIEQRRKQAAKVAVNSFKCGQQPRAAFAVQAADGSAQTIDGEGKLFAFGNAGPLLCFQFGQLISGDEVDWADPFPLILQAVEPVRFHGGIVHRIFVKVQLFGQDRRWAFEPFSGNAAHFNAALFLIFGARIGASAGLTGNRQAFRRCCHFAFQRAQRRFMDRLGGLQASEFLRQLIFVCPQSSNVTR